MNKKLSAIYLLRLLLLVLLAISLNIFLGHLVQYELKWPLFFDSIGTILVGALFGPVIGAITGTFSNIIWGLWLGDQSILPYSLTAAFIGWAAGFAVSIGAFRRIRTVLLSGFFVGISAALLSAPITTYLFGGITGGGTDYLVAHLAATSANLLQAATVQGFISDPVDKMISFVIAWGLWRVFQPHFIPPARRGRFSLESLSGYSLAVVINLLALLLCFVFLPAFERGIFSIYYLAVLVVAWRSGSGPAIFTTAIGALAQIIFLISPYHNVGITTEDLLRVLIFSIVSLAIASITGQLERNKKDLAQSLQSERESQARIRAITDSIDEAVVLISLDLHILDVNQRFTELFGVPQERVVGQNLEDARTLFDQIFVKAEDLYNWTLEIGSDTTNRHTQLVSQNWPQMRELQLFTTPVRDNKGFLGRLFVFRDVTHEREVDRMKTEFVSLVSHELRTPLTSIKGYTEMVLDGDAGEINEEVEEYLGVVFNNAERLVSLVNDLLDISRIESGRVQVKKELVDLQQVIQNVVLSMQPKVREKGQSLSVNLDPAATLVLGDRDKLVQVVTNYVSNAHKYTPSGGEIKIQMQKQADFARVAVIDNGYGISAEDQKQLFTRFYRVDNSMTREIGGTGLGLSIVKQLIELQGGETGVESEPGVGSTFYFTIPLADESKELPVEEDRKNQKTSVGGSILVVEDDNDIAHLIEHYLQKAGYKIRISHTAEDALKMIEDDLPDLITLDIDLPGIQGDDFARQIQADPLTKEIPILVISIFVDKSTGVELGAFVLPKPIDQEQLVTTVEHILQSAHQGPVLVIDDDANLLSLLEMTLKGLGLDVVTAADGITGLALVEVHRPGLVLLDMDIMGMNGMVVLQAIKKNDALADIPVIMMTSSPDLTVTARAQVLAMGASDLIAKPFNLEMLVDEVKLFLNA